MSRIVAIRQMATVASQAIRENDTGLSSRTPVTAALTPELAIAYVRELSADVRAAVVLDGDGVRIAGPEASPARPARSWPPPATGPTSPCAHPPVSSSRRAAGPMPS